MEIGAGIIIYRKNPLRFFMVSPGGPLWKEKKNWCFPKGLQDKDPSEKPFETALREFKEETGVTLSLTSEDDYEYYGLIKQRLGKFVHVFYRECLPGEPFYNFHSNSFLWKDGKEYPEIENYAWMTFEELMNSPHIKAYDKIYEEINRKEG